MIKKRKKKIINNFERHKGTKALMIKKTYERHGGTNDTNKFTEKWKKKKKKIIKIVIFERHWGTAEINDKKEKKNC